MDTVVDVLATANSGYRLGNWLLNGTGVGSMDPIQIKMNASYDLRAIFIPTGPGLTSKYDVDGDGRVDVADVLPAAKAFNSQIGDPRWNPNADMNGDGRIRVDDLLAICLHFGQ